MEDQSQSARDILDQVKLSASDGTESNAKKRESDPRYSHFRKEHTKALFSASKAPERHKAMLGARMGAEWKIAFLRLTSQQKQGFLNVLTGPRGTGKTQMGVELMAERISEAVENHLLTERYFLAPPLPALYSLVMDFFIELKSTYNRNTLKTEEQVMDKFTKPRLLVLDEFTIRGETKWEDDVLFSMIDKRYQAQKDTLLIANLKPEEVVPSLGASNASRLTECGGIIHCNWKSFRENRAV